MGIRAHAALAARREFRQFRFQTALLVEQLLGTITTQPTFQQPQMLRILRRVRHGHLMRSESSFIRFAVDDLGSGPALGRIQYDHRPARPLYCSAGTAGVGLYAPNFFDDGALFARIPREELEQ